MASARGLGYSVGILVVSDTVSKGEKEDQSGKNIERIIKSEEYFPLTFLLKDCVADDKGEIENFLKFWADNKSVNLILTVGGTGFSPRDVTPEATKAVIDREAPHLASYMVISCCQKTKFAVLSRSVSGIRGQTLILNLPGSTKGAEESLEAIISVLPHAMDQLKGDSQRILTDHIKIQGSSDDRNLCL